MSRTLVLTLNDLLNHEKKKVSPKTFILEKIDTTKKYSDMVDELDDFLATREKKLPSRMSYRKQLASMPPSYATAHF